MSENVANNVAQSNSQLLEDCPDNGLVRFTCKSVTVNKEVYEAVLRNSLRVNELEEENQQLKDKNIKLAEMVDILSSGGVGNLGYKIKNQRHEINNRLKENAKLKELLKECRNVMNIAGYFFGKIENVDKARNLLQQIDEVLK